jgi:hypothetical protein
VTLWEAREALLQVVIQEVRSTLTPNGKVRLAGALDAAEGAIAHGEDVASLLFRVLADSYESMLRQARSGARMERMRELRGSLERAVVLSACSYEESATLAACSLARAMTHSGIAAGVLEVRMLAGVDVSLRGELLITAVRDALDAAEEIRCS